MALKDKKAHIWIRRSIQITFFLFVFMVVFSHFVDKRGIDIPWPTVGNFHAICPFGAVETAGRLILEGNFIPKIHESNLWTFFGVALSTLIFGSFFCGWLCPLGSVLEWIGGMGKKLFKKRYNRLISEKVDHALGFMRYGVLALIVFATTRSGTLVFQRFDPYYALFHFWMGDVFFTALAVLGLVVLLSLFFERPWCRWLCPFGALLGLVQIISPWKIRRNEENCTSCRICVNKCPMRIPLHKKKVILDTRCNRCLSCVTSCKKEGALEYSAGPKGIYPLKKKAIAGFLAIAVFSAPVIFSVSTGYYRTSARHDVRKGTLTAEEIKGSMSLKELAEGFSMDMEVLRKVLGISEKVSDSTKLFNLEEIDESLTIGSVRMKVKEYMGG
jgi:ferredoxin